MYVGDVEGVFDGESVGDMLGVVGEIVGEADGESVGDLLG